MRNKAKRRALQINVVVHWLYETCIRRASRRSGQVCLLFDYNQNGTPLLKQMSRASAQLSYIAGLPAQQRGGNEQNYPVDQVRVRRLT